MSSEVSFTILRMHEPDIHLSNAIVTNLPHEENNAQGIEII